MRLLLGTLFGPVFGSLIMGVLASPDDLNSTAPRAEVGGGEEWPEGELPAQMGGRRNVLLPGTSLFRIPTTLAQLWSATKAMLVDRPGHPDHGKSFTRDMLKFDRNNPLVVVGGPHDGQAMTWIVTSNPRSRGKKDNPATPWISDLAFLLEIGFNDKTRPTTSEGRKAAINKYAGQTVRLEHGLSGQCRADKVRFIEVTLPIPAGSPVGTPAPTHVIADPTGTKGCGARYYTDDFKDPDAKPGEPPYSTRIYCDCGDTNQVLLNGIVTASPVNVVISGFESVDRILPPMGGTQVVQGK